MTDEQPRTWKSPLAWLPTALGEFVHVNPTGVVAPADMAEVGAGAENRPKIGRFELEPNEALILEPPPPNCIDSDTSPGNQEIADELVDKPIVMRGHGEPGLPHLGNRFRPSAGSGHQEPGRRASRIPPQASR